ncbi:MAG: hypothetical protein ACI83D_000771 [Planctomycetota bacterium]|jgi:hypothetical protein
MQDKEHEELLELTRENHEILKSLRRAQKFRNITRLFYWLIIVAIGLGAFIWIKPFLQNIEDVYDSFLHQSNEVQASFDSFNEARKDIRDGEYQEGINRLFDTFKKKTEETE